MSRSPIALASVLLVAGSALAMTSACPVTRTELDPTHCNSNGGDAWCAQQHPDGSRPYCRLGVQMCDEAAGITDFDIDGCFAEQPEDECYSACGNGVSIVDDDECDGQPMNESSGDATASGSDTASSSTGGETGESSSGSTSPPMPCAGHDECEDAAAPFCHPDDGVCVACDGLPADGGDAACEAQDATQPLCVAGACVACVPEGERGTDTTVCDDGLLVCQADNTCGPCTEHGQCASGACDVDGGTCFDPLSVLHVDGDGGQEFTSIGAAVAAIGAGTSGMIVVHELDGASPYTEAVLIDQGKAVALFAAEGEAPVVLGTAGNPGLRVEDDNTAVYVERMRFAGNTLGPGAIVDGGLLDLRRSRIVQNSGGGVVAQAGATLYAENCFIGGALDVVAFDVDGATAQLVYSTVTTSTFGSTPALRCLGASDVGVRNSIVVSQGGTSPDEIDCGATVVSSATEADVGAFDDGWFADHNNGDFSLTTDGATAFDGLAVWNTGDPAVDIGGDRRPADNGATDYAGADVPM